MSMKNFWENYKKNFSLLMVFTKKYWKALVVIYAFCGFVVYLVNFILSFYIINPKYHIGDDHFIPDLVVVLLILFLTEFLFMKYIKKKNSEHKHIDD